MLICEGGSYYVGLTDDLAQRVSDHRQGKGAAHTKGIKPVILAWYELHVDRAAAQARERQIKGWGRAKKTNSRAARLPHWNLACALGCSWPRLLERRVIQVLAPRSRGAALAELSNAP